MTKEAPQTFYEQLYQLIADAGLSLGFFSGQGLGAVLLAIIAIVLILSPTFKRASLVSLVKAWRSGK